MVELVEGEVCGHPLLVVRGEVDMANAGELGGAVCRPPGDLIVDLDELGYLDSFGVRALLAAIERRAAAGQRCVFVCQEGSAAELTLRVSGVEPGLVAATRQAAASRFAPGA